MIFVIVGISQINNWIHPVDSVKLLNYTIVNSYPHDSSAYTQGLVWYNGELYEGTGLFGGSSLRSTDLLTGEVIRIHNLSSTYFGEGITIMNDKIYQLKPTKP
jgi:glutamine cyclotransferase